MAAKNHEELLLNWLQSVHALEVRLVNILEKQAERASAMPQLQQRLYGHREESQRHADLVRGCIERRGGEVSQIREGLSKFMGEVQSRLLGTFGDSVVRDAITGSMIEQSEIASYRAIITLADRLDDQQTVDVCKEILAEEEEMFSYFDDELNNLVNHAYDRKLLIE